MSAETTREANGASVQNASVWVNGLECKRDINLTTAEKEELAHYEHRIARGLRDFIDVGLALASIKEKKLYRAMYSTFEEYCRDRWEMGRIYAYRLIGAASVVEKLLPMGNIPLPANERQVRPLLKVDPEKVPEIWRIVVEKAGDAPITTRHICAAIEGVLNGGLPTNGNGGSHDTESCDTNYIVVSVLRKIRKISHALHKGEKEQALQILESMRVLIERM